MRDYEEAIAFYVGVLGFVLIEDSSVPEQSKRWVVVATDAQQQARIGNQTGGRVFLFLHTDDFWRDFNLYTSRGVLERSLNSSRMPEA